MHARSCACTSVAPLARAASNAASQAAASERTGSLELSTTSSSIMWRSNNAGEQRECTI
ncbi:MAG TPA: hypothetical protein VF897_21395 [Roseiflexaceae bacterium]